MSTAKKLHSNGSWRKAMTRFCTLAAKKSRKSKLTIAPNARRLIMVGFMSLFVGGVRICIRFRFLDNWGRKFGFAAGQLGDIFGVVFLGFCTGIILGGIIFDKIGYGKLVITGFVL